MNIGIFIGVFQPFHLGHLETIKRALANGVEHILILMGSADRSRSINHPFNFDERFEMIGLALREAFGADAEGLCEVYSLDDHLGNDHLWIQNVWEVVTARGAGKHTFTMMSDGPYSYWFPWHLQPTYLATVPHSLYKPDLTGAISVGSGPTPVDDLGVAISCHSTTKSFFTNPANGWEHTVPQSIAEWMTRFKEKEAFVDLQEEWQELLSFREKIDSVGVPVAAHEVAVVVLNFGHVFVSRPARAKYRMALPRTLVQNLETHHEACMRAVSAEPRGEFHNAIDSLTPVTVPPIAEPCTGQRRKVEHVYLYELNETHLLAGSPEDPNDGKFYRYSDLDELADQFFGEDYFLIQKAVEGMGMIAPKRC